MKKYLLYIPLLLLASTYVSCKKVSENIQRDAIITDSIHFDIPILSEVDSGYVLSNVKLPLDPGSAIAAQLPDFNESNITSIRLARLTLQLFYLRDSKGKDSIDTDNHFGNFQSIRVTIPDIATDANSNPQPLVIASTIINSSSVNGALAMTPNTLLELKPYVGGNAATSTITIRTRKATNRILKVAATSSFTVTVSK